MAGEERKRDFINRLTTVLAYLTLVVNSSVDTFSREKERKTSLQKVIRGAGGLFASVHPSSFRIHFHSLLEKIAAFFSKSFTLVKAAFIFTPPPSR